MMIVFTLGSMSSLISSYLHSFDLEVRGAEVMMIDTSLYFDCDLCCS